MSDAAPLREGSFVAINGLPQWITVRGARRDNPVLLMLHGGPGIPLSFMTPVFSAWEEHFTVVQWDQPGGGATWSKTPEGQGALTPARYLRDAIAVTEHIRERLGVPKIGLFGMSWGTRLGVSLVHARPDLYSHYFGSSQVVSGPRGAARGWQLALDAAKARSDTAAAEALVRVGPGPYASVDDFFVRQRYTNPPGQPASAAEAEATARFTAVLRQPPPDTTYMPLDLPPQDGFAVLLATQRAVHAEQARWEIRDLGRRFTTPIHVIQGADDWNTPAELAREWVEWIDAPARSFQTIPGGSHATFVFPDLLLAFLLKNLDIP